MTLVAVPISGDLFSAHFGQSEGFRLFQVTDEATALEQAILTMPTGSDCRAIPTALAARGVKRVLAGGIGAGALRRLQDCGIEVVAGVMGGEPQQIVQDYLSGRLALGKSTCDHHHGHEHGPEHEHEHVAHHGRLQCRAHRHE